MRNREITTARMFVGLWALYVLIHQLKQIPWGSFYTWPLMVCAVVMSVVALAVLWKPSNVYLFLTLIGVQLAGVIAELPAMSNCWLFSGFVDVGILGGAVVAWRNGQGRFSVEDLYRASAPFLRCSLVGIYFFAALAKYNTDFLNPEISCATHLYRLAATAGVFVPSAAWIEASAVPVSLAVETAIPLMFLFRRTRNHGIVLGMFFHTLLASSPLVHVFDFNAVLFCLYLTMAPENFPKLLVDHPVSRAAIAVARHRVPVFGFLTVVSLFFISLSLSIDDIKPVYIFRAYLWFFLGLGMTVTTTAVLYMSRDKLLPLASPFRIRSAWVLPGLMLVVVNGALPYLGLQTGVTFTMYSNLQTEEGFENHLFVPKALRVFSLQDAPVYILESTAPELQEFSDHDRALAFFDFHRRAYKYQDAAVRYQRHETVVDVPRIEDDGTLGTPPNALASKLLYFRPIETGERSCQW